MNHSSSLGRVRWALLTAAATLGIASSAHAETRYAEPGGSGTACSLAAPCSLQLAVESATVNDGDEVVLIGGAPFTEADEVTIDDAITVVGAFGPVVQTSSPNGFRVDDPGAVLSRLSIEHSGGSAALLVERGTAEAVAARSDGAIACSLAPAAGGTAPLLRDGTCLGASGTSALSAEATGPGNAEATVRNVTAYALGPGSDGLLVSAAGVITTIAGTGEPGNTGDGGPAGSATLNSPHAVLADASFVRPADLKDFIEEAARVTEPKGKVALFTVTAGSFGEIFSFLWEVFFTEDLGEHGVAVENLIAELPTVSRVEEMAADAGLKNVASHTQNEVFEYENGAEFVNSTLVADFLLPVWLGFLDDKEKARVRRELTQLVDAEDGEIVVKSATNVFSLN